MRKKVSCFSFCLYNTLTQVLISPFENVQKLGLFLNVVKHDGKFFQGNPREGKEVEGSRMLAQRMRMKSFRSSSVQFKEQHYPQLSGQPEQNTTSTRTTKKSFYPRYRHEYWGVGRSLLGRLVGGSPRNRVHGDLSHEGDGRDQRSSPSPETGSYFRSVHLKFVFAHMYCILNTNFSAYGLHPWAACKSACASNCSDCSL